MVGGWWSSLHRTIARKRVLVRDGNRFLISKYLARRGALHLCFDKADVVIDGYLLCGGSPCYKENATMTPSRFGNATTFPPPVIPLRFCEPPVRGTPAQNHIGYCLSHCIRHCLPNGPNRTGPVPKKKRGMPPTQLFIGSLSHSEPLSSAASDAEQRPHNACETPAQR